jgi:hypothetical protein
MDEPLAKAHQAIGAYFCAFSELEHELGEVLKIVLRLQNNPAADAIVAAVRDFARKAAIVREAIEGAKNIDGSEPSSEWKSNALKTMEAVFGCNNPDRRDLSHDYLKPQPDGSISLQKPGEPARPWSAADFDRKIQKLKNLTNELRSAGTQLMTYKVQIPVPSNWMARNVTLLNSD